MNIIATILAAFLAGLSIGIIMFDETYKEHGRKEIRAEAIQHNTAEWQISPTTGDKTFTWKSKP